MHHRGLPQFKFVKILKLLRYCIHLFIRRPWSCTPPPSAPPIWHLLKSIVSESVNVSSRIMGLHTVLSQDAFGLIRARLTKSTVTPKSVEPCQPQKPNSDPFITLKYLHMTSAKYGDHFLSRIFIKEKTWSKRLEPESNRVICYLKDFTFKSPVPVFHDVDHALGLLKI